MMMAGVEEAKREARPRATLALVLSYRGSQRTYELALSDDVLVRLALEATFKGVSIGDVVASRIILGDGGEGNGKEATS